MEKKLNIDAQDVKEQVVEHELKSPDEARTVRKKSGDITGANVGIADHCLLTDTPEQVRPDTGDPCLDGRDGS